MPMLSSTCRHALFFFLAAACLLGGHAARAEAWPSRRRWRWS